MENIYIVEEMWFEPRLSRFYDTAIQWAWDARRRAFKYCLANEITVTQYTVDEDWTEGDALPEGKVILRLRA